ncbi:auxin-responsive protein IAA33 [Andrographis paniculata]|uniref:auxin-responsive protein IAA33 n=1 Tax=Andrographis paniculata TaxID=175694 RepID=UPI0021E79BF1|nr:auxin-responsive protein IAA33 [Andrographis paniculata]
MSSSFDSQRHQTSFKRPPAPSPAPPWQDRRLITAVEASFFHLHPTANPNPAINASPLQRHPSSSFFADDDELVAAVVPPVTVVLEGRCICQRISLHKHGSYQSLARALRQMFLDVVAVAVAVDGSEDSDHRRSSAGDADVDLENAIPGYVIAYEDMENDLLLAGDLNWKDFVRVAKRIRILPAKAKSRKLHK